MLICYPIQKSFIKMKKNVVYALILSNHQFVKLGIENLRCNKTKTTRINKFINSNVLKFSQKF